MRLARGRHAMPRVLSTPAYLRPRGNGGSRDRAHALTFLAIARPHVPLQPQMATGYVSLSQFHYTQEKYPEPPPPPPGSLFPDVNPETLLCPRNAYKVQPPPTRIRVASVAFLDLSSPSPSLPRHTPPQPPPLSDFPFFGGTSTLRPILPREHLCSKKATRQAHATWPGSCRSNARRVAFALAADFVRARMRAGTRAWKEMRQEVVSVGGGTGCTSVLRARMAGQEARFSPRDMSRPSRSSIFFDRAGGVKHPSVLETG